MKRSLILPIMTLLLLLFLHLPIVMLVLDSFNASRFGGGWTGFSMVWYERLLQTPDLWRALRNSLLIATTATVVSTVIGTLAALALHRYQSRLQRTHYGLVYVPLVVPDILMGISLLIFFVSLHTELGLGTIFLAHTTFCVSYVTMVVLARLQDFDMTLIDAARDLGAGSWTIFRRVLLPLLAPGIVSGALLAFTLSFDDFVITFFVAGPGSTTLPIQIYSMIKHGATPLINALSTILLAVTFVIVLISQKLCDKPSRSYS